MRFHAHNYVVTERYPMNISLKENTVKLANVLTVCFDVSKDVLNLYYEIDFGEETLNFEDEFRNNTTTIRQKLQKIQLNSMKYGYKNLRIICEPTGGYQEKLLKTARTLKMFTALVSTEAVSKFRVIESNDTGKTDLKDPKIINSLAKLGKVLKHRILDEEFSALRQLNSLYENEEKKFVRQKCKMHKVLRRLFCDFSFKKDFLYGSTGRFLIETYNCDPKAITERGFSYFSNRMQRNVKGVRKTTLERLWKEAKSSMYNQISERLRKTYIREIQMEWEQLKLFEKNREELKIEMTELVKEMRSKDKKIPKATKGIVSELNIARLLGELGPYTDFKNINQVYRYAGLNIRQYESGKMKGKDRTCKKGRPLLRKVLSQIIVATTRRDRFYGEHYHKKKNRGKRGNLLMVELMRKFLKTFYGWYKSGKDFDPDRVFVCEGIRNRVA